MRGAAFCVLCGLVSFNLAPAAGQLFENATQVYHNMTYQWDVRHRGGIDLPLCVKKMMNCWEVMRADLICADYPHAVYESACGMWRHRCHDLRPWGLDYGYTYSHFSMARGPWCDIWGTRT